MGFDEPVTSLAFSPRGDFLATTHVGKLGIYLWANRTLYADVAISSVTNPDANEAIEVRTLHLPSSAVEAGEKREDLDLPSNAEEEMRSSSDQLAADLITFSRLPTSRWVNLSNLDEIKRRNKPLEAPKAPKSAPFFLSTKAGS